MFYDQCILRRLEKKCEVFLSFSSLFRSSSDYLLVETYQSIISIHRCGLFLNIQYKFNVIVKKGFLLILSIIPSVILLSCNIIELTVLNLSLHTSSKFLLSTRIIVLTNSLYKISRRYAKDQFPSLYSYV